MEREHPLALALPRDHERRRFEGRTKLAGDTLEQPDVLRRPGAWLAHLIEDQHARELATETDGRRDRGERAAIDERVAAERGIGEPRVGARIADRDRAPLARRECAER